MKKYRVSMRVILLHLFNKAENGKNETLKNSQKKEKGIRCSYNIKFI